MQEKVLVREGCGGMRVSVCVSVCMHVQEKEHTECEESHGDQH